MRSDMSASVSFTHVRTDEVSKMATIAAKLGANLEMEKDLESKTQDVTLGWRSKNVDEIMSALVILLAAQDRTTPDRVIEKVTEIVESFGYPGTEIPEG